MFLVRWEICHLLCWEFQCSLVRPLGLCLPKVTGTEEEIELAGFCDKDLSGCDVTPSLWLPGEGAPGWQWAGEGGGNSWNPGLELALPAEQTTQCPCLKI